MVHFRTTSWLRIPIGLNEARFVDVPVSLAVVSSWKDERLSMLDRAATFPNCRKSTNKEDIEQSWKEAVSSHSITINEEINTEQEYTCLRGCVLHVVAIVLV